MKVIVSDVVSFKESILRKGFSFVHLGRELGISSSYASQIANGSRNPGPSTAKKITELLEVEFDEIFFVEHAHKSGQIPEQQKSCE